MQSKKIDPTPRELSTLINGLGNGNLRIPGFQRDFVWEPERIQKLLDSMCKEYPIGTIFLWRAPSDYNHLIRNLAIFGNNPIQEGQRYEFILDGQQRLTSLFAVINGLTIEGKDYNQIVIDLDVDLEDGDELRLFRNQDPDNQRYVSVKMLLGSDNLEVFDNLPSKEYKARFQKYQKILLNYPMSVVTVSDMKIDDAIEIFERINRQGRELSRYDLVTASVFSEKFDLRQKTEDDILEPIAQKGFGKIAESTIPQLLALNIVGNTESSTQMKLKGNQVVEVWERSVECYLSAIALMQTKFGVFNVRVIPYDSMAAVLAYYFFYSKNRTITRNHLTQIESWFWRVAFSERYSGSSQTRMSEDAVLFRNLIDDGKPIDLPLSADLTTLLDSRITYTTSAVRNGILCLLNLQKPLHPLNATSIEVTYEAFENMGRTTVHRIFPKSKHIEGDRNALNRLPNFAFFPAEVTEQLDINNSRPSIYMDRLANELGDDFERVMLSHLIPIDKSSGIWDDDYDKFLKQRARLMLARIYQVAGITQSVEMDDADVVVNTIEKALRDKIHSELKGAYGDNYWEQAIPRTVKTEIRTQFEKDIKKAGVLNEDDYKDFRYRLDYTSPKHYWEIMNHNISHFEGFSQDNGERYLKDWQDFRNITKHNRNADTLLAAKATVSFIWLSRFLELDLSKYGMF